MNYKRLGTACVAGLSLIAAVCSPSLTAQDVRIRVLNSHNGRPVTDECLNIWIDYPDGPSFLLPTGRNGVVTLAFSEKGVTANPVAVRACNGSAKGGSRSLPNGATSISVAPDYYVPCEHYEKAVPGEPVTRDTLRKLMPSYSLRAIIDAGMSTANTCSKRIIKADSGELVYFVRPIHWWEAMRE